MPLDPPSQLNISACKADFSYAITVNTIEIRDTGKGAKSVADDLEAVLRKIEAWHQGSIAGFKISYRDSEGLEHEVPWDGKQARSARRLGGLGMFRALCFFLLLGSALAEDPLDALARAASSFSAAIGQQLKMLERDPSPREFAQKTIDYATAKTAYFEALQAAMPAMIKNALSEGKSQKLDAFITAFSVAGEKTASDG